MNNHSKTPVILMGNEAIARAIVEHGCFLAASYPGTPASEILSSIARLKKEYNLDMHVEWSVNEKCAFEVALSASYAGYRAVVAMKQVGLNVALDPLMSAAYTGTIGGFIICSADDPGPHSSQTEQDSRMLAMFAKIPVFDPSSPRDAYKCILPAYMLSEKYQIPVMVRPTTRVCHARQNITTNNINGFYSAVSFEKNPSRWAATPRYRYDLHKLLNKKIEKISLEKKFYPLQWNKTPKKAHTCIIASGVAFAHVADIIKDTSLGDSVDIFKVLMPYPLNKVFIKTILESYKHILIIEEPYGIIELQFPEKKHIYGKSNGFVPCEGELTPDIIEPILHHFFHRKKTRRKLPANLPGQRPSLCPGCPHRASFFAIKKAFPNALYPSDIGCYTLGINLGVVDTCLCMGASINQASGLFHALSKNTKQQPPIIATIGDSTFLHSGIPALINAHYNGARFILVILDNSTTAMTGNQPTALSGIRVDGSRSKPLDLEKVIEGLGIAFLKNVDPYRVPDMINTLKEAALFLQKPDGGIAVIIAKHPCLMNIPKTRSPQPVISNSCTGCGYCVKHFECPALSITNGKCEINTLSCTGCGVCIHACPIGAITMDN
ncbi:MAG: indolepyruvate ferredoxin oxidoreductase subunit alpha [Desulfobacterota bacterium]|nr:indolepyruvate ferredoxin oxidoreductase subunit alpha [Thermodesulfobacteriota bacterium]